MLRSKIGFIRRSSNYYQQRRKEDIMKEADIKWLDDPEVFRVNQLPAHSDHKFYASQTEYDNKTNNLIQSLNGTWQFQFSKNAMSRPVEFYREDFDASNFDTIVVPGHIELAGYDKIHYINFMYPWEGSIYRRPAYSLELGPQEGSFSEAEYNPVGSYRTMFDLNPELNGKRVSICFEGVEQAMYLWLNGVFIGYAEDSFTPSEFDLTDAIKEKGNLLAVEVHKRSTAAYLENQDFFRFFGIFRNVSLYAKPQIHLEDMWLKPMLDVDNQVGTLAGEFTFSYQIETGSVVCKLLDEDGHLMIERAVDIKEKSVLEEVSMNQVIPWDHQSPYLYTLLLYLYDKDGNIVEIVPYQIGFRKVEIREKTIYLNGKRLIIKGVNRHEWSAETGRAISQDDMLWDMNCIRRNHINAVRTCHYPDQIPWYYLCDTNGIYLMAETNLETHGSWQKLGGNDPSWNMPGSLPQWKEVVVDRARTNFETFKNHTSILFWSLGNESYAGDNIKAMNEFYKIKDPDRLVHYEGVCHDRAYEDVISDVESQMYTPPQRIREYLDHEPKKPFLLCEYMHDMGNSMGGLKSYMELLDCYENYHGGFIWDFIDQALFVCDSVTGNKVLRYGGDFDDRPADYEFSGDGIVFANRVEKPAIQEVSYYYGLY